MQISQLQALRNPSAATISRFVVVLTALVLMLFAVLQQRPGGWVAAGVLLGVVVVAVVRLSLDAIVSPVTDLGRAIRSSTTRASWLGITGRRRSRGLSISSPSRSTWRLQA
jgi:hypothetical protein